jgi:hypothetical protein
LLLVGVFGAVSGYLSSSEGRSQGALEAEASPAFLRGVVQNVAGDRVTISTETGSIELRLAQNAPVEALRPATPPSLAIGDWINAGAIGHMQTLLALVGLVVIAPDRLEAPR